MKKPRNLETQKPPKRYALRDLVKEGRISRTGNGRRNSPFYYSIAGNDYSITRPSPILGRANEKPRITPPPSFSRIPTLIRYPHIRGVRAPSHSRTVMISPLATEFTPFVPVRE